VSDAQSKRLAVLYFTTPQDSLRYLADAFTEGVISQLRLVTGLDVVSRDGVAAFRGSLVNRDSVVRALGAGTLVEGVVDPAPDGVQVNVQLIDAASNAVFQRKGFAIRTDRVQGSIDSVTRTVADFLRQRLGEEIVLQSGRTTTRSGVAWASLQRALVSGKRADSVANELGLTAETLATYQAADSMFDLARSADPQWSDPLIQMAGLAYRRSRMVGADPVLAAPWVNRSLAYADSAVRQDPENAEALEVRGTTQYWAYLLRLYADAAEAARRLASARADLEKAVARDHRRATAWATLSHLHYQPGMGGRTEVLLAARRAYEEDAYLAGAQKVLSRLFLASYDNGQAVDAEHWCQEGARRFPAAAEFVECRLILMTMRGAVPDIPLAWRLGDSTYALTPEPDRLFFRSRTRLFIAAALARGGSTDSARRVLSTTPITPQIDPQGDLHQIEAFVQVLLGDKDAAFRALRQAFAASHATFDIRDTNWWFQPLADDPRYADVTGPPR
jgi:TolB-like protein